MSLARRLARPVALFAALLTLPALAHAQNKDGSVELGVAYTFIRFDTQTLIDNKLGASFLAGYNFTKRHGAEIMATRATATPEEGASFDLDVSIYRIGYTYSAYPKPKISSFFRFGLGVLFIDPEDVPFAPSNYEDKVTDVLVYSGGGFRYFFSQRFGLRFDGTVDFVESGQGIGNASIQATGTFGLIVLLGGHETPEKETPPAEEPKPEDAPADGEKPEGETKPPVPRG